MNSLYIIVAVLATVTLLTSIGATSLQHTVFAASVDDTAKSQGQRVSSHAWGDPDEINGHGEDVSDAARR
jgi:hypothetical protein